MWPAVGVSVLICLACAWIFARPNASPEKSAAYTMIRSPLDLWSVGRFAVLLSFLTIGANLMARTFGSYGLDLFAATAGLVDVDAVTLAVGKLANTGIAPETAVTAILIGITANQLFKLAASFIAANGAFSVRFAVTVALAFVGGATAHFFGPFLYS